MKRLTLFVVVLALPAASFAQGAPTREAKMLGQLGLTDSQITQVMDIQKKTTTTVRQDGAQIRLLRAQMAQALLPSNPDMQKVNDLISQQSQARADMQKALVGARVQLREVMGDQAFHAYVRHLRAMHRRRFHRWGRQQGRCSIPWDDGFGGDAPQQQ